MELTYPGGEIMRYEYNPDGNLEAAVDSEGNQTHYRYDGNGRLTAIHRPDGSTEQRSYDKAGRLIRQTGTAGDGSIITDFEYSYDGFGNLTRTTAGNPVHIPDGTILPGEKRMEYNEANQLIRYNGETVRYDKKGNMTYGPLDGVMESFTYDCRNRLIQAGSTTYTYDAENNRIASTTDGITTEYVIDTRPELSQVLEEYQKGQLIRTYLYGNGQLIGDKFREADVEPLLGTMSLLTRARYYHYDNIGSTRALTDEQGNILETYNYGIYGELLSGNAGLTGYLYNGAYGVHTDRNGLYYMRARYYNTDICRFINQDILTGSPLESQSLNRYAYCVGNPVNQIDPFGLCAIQMLDNLTHFTLDILGCIPVIGIPFNAVHAAIYFKEGDVINGIFCTAAAVVGLGDGILGAGKLLAEMGKAGKMVCAINKAGILVRASGIGLMTATSAVLTVDNAAYTYTLLKENDFHWTEESLLSLGETALYAASTVMGIAELGNCIDMERMLEAKGMACFPAGTKVLTEEGLKNIEDIEAGDKVYSTNEETGESGYQEVVQTFEKETDVIVHVFYQTERSTAETDIAETDNVEADNEDIAESGRAANAENADQETAESSEIETTMNHRFWSEGGWKTAGTLEQGDRLTLADGTEAVVTDIIFEDRHTTVYNMEVADYHTYYVGEDSVWVHNQCGSTVEVRGNEGASGYSAESPALKDSPYNPDVVEKRMKPNYKSNPAHNAKSSYYNPRKTPEPDDAKMVYENQKSSNIAEAKNAFNEVIGAELLSKAYQSYLKIINSKLDDAIISFTDVIYKNATENQILTFLNSYIYDSLDKLNKQQI